MSIESKRVHLIMGIMLAPLLLCMACRQRSEILIKIDAANSTGPISPYIYGSNEGNWALPDRHLTFGRQGGNRMTAYNWVNNASNAGNDWQNQSDDYLMQNDQAHSNTPGEFPRKAVAEAQAAGATFLVTIPMAGYVAADKNGGGDVNQTPDYIHKRFKVSAPRKNASFVYPPDRNSDTVYQDEFVSWLEKRFPNRQPGADIWYSLDNEPDLWSGTHSRIHPAKASYAEIIEKTVAMSKAIKAVAPKTLIFGPASYGWSGYVSFQGAADAADRDFLDFYLASMKGAEQDAGKRLLDVLDLHWYPEVYGDGKRITDQLSSPNIAHARMQATRSLWDPTFVEDSWIAKSLGGKPIDLLHRMKDKIAKNYPGTKLAFTEYQYGGGNDISGAIAEADALGIFGREGVFAAALWPLGGDSSFVDAAFSAFRNCDGQGAQFGDLALDVANPDPTHIGFYASKFSKGSDKIVCVITNQSSQPKACALAIGGMKTTTERQFTMTSAQAKFMPGQFAERSGNSLHLTLAPLSVNVLELR